MRAPPQLLRFSPPHKTPLWKPLKTIGVPKSEFFECTFGPPSSHPFSLIFPPSLPFRSCSLSHHVPPRLPSSPPPLSPLFVAPGKLRFRYPSNLGTLKTLVSYRTWVAANFLRILGFSGVAAVSRYTPPKTPCRTCRPSTARGVAHQAASEKVSRNRGCRAATLAGVVPHCVTMPQRPLTQREFPELSPLKRFELKEKDQETGRTLCREY